MAVRLQTTEGKIKKYDTIYGEYSGGGGGAESGGHYSPDKWVAYCGREWEYEPKPYEECDHLDCAIHLARKRSDAGPVIFMFCGAIGLGIIIIKPGDFTLFPALMTALCFLVAFSKLIQGFKAGKQFDELNEYKHKNTVNGVRAWKFFDDQEETGAKHWYQFWK
jgi:hypothetical protein